MQLFNKFLDNNSQKGQALIIVVLVLVTALTIGLSVATRSVTNTRLSTEEEQSKKAFSAAEAGIERTLKSNSYSEGLFSGSGGSNASFSASVSPVSGDFIINEGSPVPKNEGVDIWLSQYPDYASPTDGTLTVYWGTTSDGCSDAAMEIVVISGPLATPVTSHFAYDPCAARVGSNGFSLIASSQATVGNKTFYFNKDIPVTSGLIARVVPLYSNTPIGARGDSDSPLPQQGSLIESTGVSGDTQRKIKVFRGYPKVTEKIQLEL